MYSASFWVLLKPTFVISDEEAKYEQSQTKSDVEFDQNVSY